jgi:hypothetical protein
MNTQSARDPIVGSSLNNNVAGEETNDQEQLVALIEAELRCIGGGEYGPCW